MAKLLDSETLALDQDGHSELANLATNNELSADKLKVLSIDRLKVLKNEVAKMRIQDATKPALTKLLDEAIASKNSSTTATPTAPAATPTPNSTPAG